MNGSTHHVTSADGVSLAVHTRGEAGHPAVVAVHGYPDNHHVWNGVAALLADRFHVAAYDVRGCGDSDKPTARSAYRQSRLTEDLLAVVDSVSPDEPVHVIAHDWGSIQSWATLADPRAAGRIASFTSVSGPSLDHAGAWLRQARQHPRAALRQLGHSYYVGLFQLPVLPEAAARRGVIDRAARTADAQFRTVEDKVNGIELYRANLRSLLSPRPPRVELPVQVIVPEQDAFVTPALAEGAPRPWVADLTVHRLTGSHWVVAEQPELIAGLVADFARQHASTGSAR